MPSVVKFSAREGVTKFGNRATGRMLFGNTVFLFGVWLTLLTARACYGEPHQSTLHNAASPYGDQSLNADEDYLKAPGHAYYATKSGGYAENTADISHSNLLDVQLNTQLPQLIREEAKIDPTITKLFQGDEEMTVDTGRVSVVGRLRHTQLPEQNSEDSDVRGQIHQHDDVMASRSLADSALFDYDPLHEFNEASNSIEVEPPQQRHALYKRDLQDISDNSLNDLLAGDDVSSSNNRVRQENSRQILSNNYYERISPTRTSDDVLDVQNMKDSRRHFPGEGRRVLSAGRSLLTRPTSSNSRGMAGDESDDIVTPRSGSQSGAGGQNKNPDFQEILTGFVKLLNGQTSPGRGAPPRTRINNRGPPRITDVPPIIFDAPPPAPLEPTGPAPFIPLHTTSDFPYTFEAPAGGEMSYSTGASHKDQINPTKPIPSASSPADANVNIFNNRPSIQYLNPSKLPTIPDNLRPPTPPSPQSQGHPKPDGNHHHHHSSNHHQQKPHSTSSQRPIVRPESNGYRPDFIEPTKQVFKEPNSNFVPKDPTPNGPNHGTNTIHKNDGNSHSGSKPSNEPTKETFGSIFDDVKIQNGMMTSENDPQQRPSQVETKPMHNTNRPDSEVSEKEGQSNVDDHRNQTSTNGATDLKKNGTDNRNDANQFSSTNVSLTDTANNMSPVYRPDKPLPTVNTLPPKPTKDETNRPLKEDQPNKAHHKDENSFANKPHIKDQNFPNRPHKEDGPFGKPQKEDSIFSNKPQKEEILILGGKPFREDIPSGKPHKDDFSNGKPHKDDLSNGKPHKDDFSNGKPLKDDFFNGKPHDLSNGRPHKDVYKDDLSNGRPNKDDLSNGRPHKDDFSNGGSDLHISPTPSAPAASVIQSTLRPRVNASTGISDLELGQGIASVIEGLLEPSLIDTEVKPTRQPTPPVKRPPPGGGYYPRPGIVLDDTEYKPGVHRRPPGIIATTPVSHGDIFDVTVSAIQGPGGGGSNGSKTGQAFVYPVELEGANGDVSVITSAQNGQQFVSIDGKRTYLNLFGEPSASPNPPIKPTQAGSYAVSHLQTPHPPSHPHQSSSVAAARPPTWRKPAHPPVRIDTCIVGDDSTCDTSQHERCRTEFGVSSCHCRPGYARRKHREPCHRIVSIGLSLRVDKLFDQRLIWSEKYKDADSEEYQHLEFEAVRAIDSALSMTPFSDIFMAARVHNMYPAKNNGLTLNMTLSLAENGETLRPAITGELAKHVQGAIGRRQNNVGTSGLWVDSGPGVVSLVQDINECSSPELNDCSPSARCANVFGSFQCTCPEGTRDPWVGNLHQSGRSCELCDPTSHCNQRGTCSYQAGQPVCKCTGSFYGAQCEIDGEVLGVAIGASVCALLIILVTLICLCSWSRRWNREQKIGSPVFGYMPQGGSTVKTPSIGGPPYQVSLEDRLRWAQIADAMAHANHYAPEPVMSGGGGTMNSTRPSSALFGYSLPHHPVPLPRLRPPPPPQSQLRTPESSTSEEEDRTDLLGRNFQVPRPKSRSSVANQSGIYYDVDYEQQADVFSQKSHPSCIPMNTYTMGSRSHYYRT